MIATSITANNKAAAKAFADLQKTFVGVYSAIKGQGRRITNGDISQAKSKAMRAFRNVSPMPELSSSDPRWSRSKQLVDISFKAWNNLGRITPR
ncbi:MAG: hypothetical protein CMM83_04800 [Rhodospirillales bacterium]|nr:hypothetical protein [Rhodospirillales bacterium]|tara:strand:+ start:1811 stop:2092 length:282 start_codon:yes stop_codon:yes gene_type:complete